MLNFFSATRARLLLLLACAAVGAVPALALTGCHAGDDVNVNTSGTGTSPVTGSDANDDDPGDDG